MTNNKLPDYTLIDTEAALADFCEVNQAVDWFAFDTEFIGEKRYTTLLCLIQVATEHGLYLIDTIKINDLSDFLGIIEDEKVLKITHAGENDYRLLYILFGTVPKNLFDTQVAGGFIGYNYPVSFRRLVEGELKVRLKKGFGVTDWERRPMSAKQIDYALDDVIYLKELHDLIMAKAEKNGRAEWIMNECKLWEDPQYYYQDPNREALNSTMMRHMRQREKVFLLRIYAWRDREAKRKDYSRDMVLQRKLIAPITKAMGAGRSALSGNRRIPDHITRRYGDTFFKMYEAPATEEELEILSRVKAETEEDLDKAIMTEMLHLIIRSMCLKKNLSVNLVVPRSIIRDMKADPDFFEPILETTWRKQFLGEKMIFWLKNRNQLEMNFDNGNFEIEMNK